MFAPTAQTPAAAFHGIRRLLAEDLEALNQRICRQLTSPNDLLNAIARNYLATKGKQIRPIIVMLAARMWTHAPASQRVLCAASSVELLHNASLIHDDIVDESKLRRGVATINAMWDNHIAVLVGDFFISCALREAFLSGVRDIVGCLSDLGRTLTVGELDQASSARDHVLTYESYFTIISRKTASLFEACARMGCLAVGADAGFTDALCRYAHLLGLCFQIRDDIFDYTGDGSAIGKPTGNDLREGKVTLPLLYALLEAPDSRVAGRDGAFSVLSSRQDALTDQDIALLIDFAVAGGGIDYAYSRMARLRDEAAGILRGLPDSPERQALADTLDYIIARPN